MKCSGRWREENSEKYRTLRSGRKGWRTHAVEVRVRWKKALKEKLKSVCSGVSDRVDMNDLK